MWNLEPAVDRDSYVLNRTERALDENEGPRDFSIYGASTPRGMPRFCGHLCVYIVRIKEVDNNLQRLNP